MACQKCPPPIPINPPTLTRLANKMAYMVKDKFNTCIIIRSGASVSYINRNYKGGQYVNHNFDMDNDAEFSGDIYFA